MIEPELALRATGLALGLWGALSAIESLADLGAWRNDGPLGWPLQGLRRGRWTGLPGLGALWSRRGLTGLLLVQLASSLALLAAPVAAGFALFWLVTLLLALRLGPNGADKIALVVAAGGALQALGLALAAPRLWLAGVLWTGGQLTIAYFAAGASKLVLAPWRSGAAMRDSLSSYAYGHRWAAATLRGPAPAAALAWAVMLAEALFPLALLLPAPMLAAVLAGFFVFHLAIAATMGLNTYPWAFLAAYPAVLLLGQTLRGALGWG